MPRKELSPLWIGWLVLLIIGIITHSNDWLVPLLLFIILFMGVVLEDNKEKLKEYDKMKDKQG